MQETRVLVETRGTTGEETISYWFDLPIDVAEFEEKLGIGAESGDYRIIEKVLPYADEVHEHTSVYQLNELDLPLQCVDDSNKLFGYMSNGYSMWFAFSAFLGIVSCKCHVKAD